MGEQQGTNRHVGNPRQHWTGMAKRATKEQQLLLPLSMHIAYKDQ